MAGRGISRHVIVIRVCPLRAVTHQTPQAVGSEQIAEAVEKVVAKLIDDDDEHESRPRVSCRLLLPRGTLGGG
jgi:hypothetical protein